MKPVVPKHRIFHQTSGLFLLELMCSILLFAVAASFCVRIFVKARLLSSDARALNQAVALCTNAAELCSTSDSPEEASEKLLRFYPESRFQESDPLSVRLSLNRELQPVPETELSPSTEAYVLCVTLSQEDSFLVSEISVQKSAGKETLYNLHTVHYLQGGDTYE